MNRSPDRIGIVDLGTMSLRFDIFQISETQREPAILFRHRAMPRLGEDLYKHQNLRPETKNKLLAEFHVIQENAKKFSASRIIAVGTSALREYSGSTEFVEEIFSKSGIRLQLISGEEEARLTALGILTFETLPNGSPMLIDIGGGSTEITFCSKGVSLLSLSIEVGALRLLQSFGEVHEGERQIRPHKIAATQRHLQEIFEVLQRKSAAFSPDYLIGSSGTARALERFFPKVPNERLQISTHNLESLILELQNKSLSELRALPEMDASRVDVILPGALILHAAAKAVNGKFVIVTPYSLRHGVLVEELRKMKTEF